MAKFEVEVVIGYTKTLNIFAKSEDEAEEKAENLVNSWENVYNCEVLSVSEA